MTKIVSMSNGNVDIAISCLVKYLLSVNIKTLSIYAQTDEVSIDTDVFKF